MLYYNIYVANDEESSYNLISKINEEAVMNKLATTKLSSRGQIVIPEEIREQMHMHTGDQFIVFAEKDIVILKAITRPDISEFDSLVTKARRKAAELGMTKADLGDAIKEARK